LIQVRSNPPSKGYGAPERVTPARLIGLTLSETCGRESVARIVSLTFVLTVGVLVLAGSASAGLLSGVLPGVVAPADTPSSGSCEETVTQPFARWGDSANYVLMPGGTFEPGVASWSLSKGGRIVRGNESFYVHAPGDAYALELPPGSSALTPPNCFAFGDWKLRFFVAGSGGRVRVNIVVRSLLLGSLSTLDGGTVRGGSTWQPSPEVRLAVTNLTGLVAVDAVSVRFTSTGSSTVRIDDAYLDPWKVT
jgi:hypothetical protein